MCYFFYQQLFTLIKIKNAWSRTDVMQKIRNFNNFLIEFQNNICSILYPKQNETTSLNERFYLDKTNRSGRRKVKIVQNIKAVG